jgi:hypothetical protein
MDKNLEFHSRLNAKGCRLQLMTINGSITLSAVYELRKEISDHIIASVNDNSLCILRDAEGIPNLVCRGDKIVAFYFNFVDPNPENSPYNTAQLEHLKAATEYYKSMTQSEGWKKGESWKED